MAKSMQANAKIKSATLEITVTRADGTVEHHGIVARYEKNRLKRLLRRVTGRNQ